MLNLFRPYSILLVGALMSVSAWAQSPPAGKFDVDVAHSQAGFDVTHLRFSTVTGRFTDFNGKIHIADRFRDSSVEAEVQMASVDTANEKRDNHLKSEDFFEVETHPTMTFKSTRIQGRPSSFRMTGDLTIKGVTQPVVFKGKFLGRMKDGFGNEKVAFEAETKISRKDFGITWNDIVEGVSVVGDEVTIKLSIQGGRPLAKEIGGN